jgi:uncharacterized membrane protein YedE/YeeE
MSLPLGWTNALSGLVFGSLFGFVLQRGGLGNGCRLTAQLRLQDWTVFNVMFTAIIVAATGLYLLQSLGFIAGSDLYVPTMYLWATLLGGALVGVGMGVGGYCPGTSVVGALAGRLDGLVFFAGLIIGVIVFAWTFGPMQPLLAAAQGPDGQTLGDLLHISNGLVLAILGAVAAVVGWLSRRVRTSTDISCAD